MLHKATTLQTYQLDSLDGEMGRVKDFYFDDQSWGIRYLIADTGTWLSDRKVLISPHALLSAMRKEKNISVSLTKAQIEDSPSLDTDKPVSRQFEENYHGFFGWPGYWAGSFPMAAGYPMGGTVPAMMVVPEMSSTLTEEEKESWDPHLRSTKEVLTDKIEAKDGSIGHVDDFIIDEEHWIIRYLVIDTVNWWPGKKVLVSPKWIERISWEESTVFLNLTRDAIRSSPEYTDEALVSREYETGLYRHYNIPAYWES